MVRILTALFAEPAGWFLIVAAIPICGLAAFGASVFYRRRLYGRRSALFATAINNMSQGVVMFDSSARLVLCNGRYLEMYGLSPSVVKPGSKLVDVMHHRFATGSIASDPKKYCTETLTAMAEGKTIDTIVKAPDGRSILVVNRPVAGGQHWVGTHEDITERLI